MFVNRLRQPSASHRLPSPPSRVSAAGFVFVATGGLPAVSPEQRRHQEWLYQMAWEQAQLVGRPSLPERDLLGVWN